ncbi:cytochrome-c oxidase, cbb3-type subunit III [Aquincola sp. S2]|uniref:Cbb3-type cytochrome c oxidase subunit n=1 Tax=Pseudaquabacterium terrae TaxID=2732868 RepID=A0ABX2EQH5_9BURK|nr:cytochrome-c oxidase, cbb3-type subunit III [Aquabacterium terrae]NRF70965.1 cytochrome-c oxidase, cbb3-type subunit III [Aquabacterium terrae]
MSDFFNEGWSTYIAVVTAVSILACLVLLIIAARTKAMAADNTTGHVWDENLRELNNPLPMWWMGLFVLTIVFSAIYLVFYPGLGSFQGSLGWSQKAQYEAEIQRANQELAPLYARFDAMSVEQLAADGQALRVGERLFVNNCAQCHGSDARGSKGFPDLTDTDWLYGGSPDAIIHTIAKGRIGTMPPMAAAVGSSDDVRNLANYVLSLSGSPHNEIQAHLGRSKFTACAACHGMKGQGNPALGAPNLADRVWLHGWGDEAIANIIRQGKVNTMPAHADKLTPSQIRVLAGYVWGQSHPH